MKRKFISIVIIMTILVSQVLSLNVSYAKSETTSSDTKENIETKLNLANNKDYTWSYDSSSDSWIMSIVTTVVNPEIEDEQGVSVCVPNAYVTGIDTNYDGTADVTSSNYSEAVNGKMITNTSGTITSTNGQVYTATTCPVIINTGAAGYGNQSNQKAGTTYAKEGYINVACGNRGKQDTATDSSGNTYYTGDAPLCLVDQKNAVRFVKYNILLGNIPGSVDYFVSTGGSGGGAHATMLAATSNNEDFYDYEIEAGAVGVYQNSDGTYSTSVTINGQEVKISDGLWGCMAYSAITPLYSADMAMAFEYYLDTDYSFNTDYQKKMAELLAKEYMEYINGQNLSVKESDVNLDINSDGDKTDTIKLTIEYDTSKYADTNGYGGTYLDYYLAEFVSNLQWYVDNLDYGEGWTWFDSDGNALSDSDVASMTSSDKAKAFIEGRYATGTSSSSKGGPGGNMGGGAPSGNMPGGETPSNIGNMTGEMPSGNPPSDMGNMKGGPQGTSSSDSSSTTEKVGTPDQGTTQSATSKSNSSNYSTFKEMYEEYESDIKEVTSGDKYGKNIVNLYDPIQYIGADTTENPTWTRILMGAQEGDMSMMSSLNMQAVWLSAGTNCDISWQWNGGHVPSEILGDSLALYVDQMYGKYVSGAKTITKAEATSQTTNGTATSSTGTDISSWVTLNNGKISFDLSDAASYRTSGASKSTPGFDVMDYGQEDYVFGSSSKDARHWDTYVLKVMKNNYSTLEELFNGEVTSSSSSSNSSNNIYYYVIGGCAVVLVVILAVVVIKRRKTNKFHY